MARNPFVIGRYAGPKYFCDRELETSRLVEFVTNGNNVMLTAQRRMGKTDLINHLFAQGEIKQEFITIMVDIYSTRTLGEFILYFGRAITDALRPRGKAIVDRFVEFLPSIKAELTFDFQGMPVWGIGIGETPAPDITLQEIFKYIDAAPMPCLIAIDEFQQIVNYPNGSQAEALLRTHIQRCQNAQFIFSGSQRHLMAEMFTSPSRPFFQSTTLMGLSPLKTEVYQKFCRDLFVEGGKHLDPEVPIEVYNRFDGITAYMHRVMNQLYSSTSANGNCTTKDIDGAIEILLETGNDAYQMLYQQIPNPQREVLLALAAEVKAERVTSGAFVKKHNLTSPSSVSSALRILQDKDIVVRDLDTYVIYDRFFSLWLRRTILNQ